MKGRRLLVGGGFLFAALTSPAWAVEAELAKLGTSSTLEFSPQARERFQIPVEVVKKATLTVRVLDADGQLVRVIKRGTLAPGQHKVEWDGKDESGRIVPNEVYVPVIEATARGTTTIYDPRQHSGGESVAVTSVRALNTGGIEYSLPEPARVLIRVGVKSGPMLRSLAVWQPRAAGLNVERWDGMDSTGRIRFVDGPDLAFLVLAFALPKGAIITTGNDSLSYLEYRKAQGSQATPAQAKPADVSARPTERDGRRIQSEYFDSPLAYREPALTLVVEPGAELEKNSDGAVILHQGKNVRLRVTVPDEDKWLLQEQLYEVAFFVNYEFVSEEERGYLPLTWAWTPGSVAPGVHVISANVTGLGGRVGTASVPVDVRP